MSRLEERTGNQTWGYALLVLTTATLFIRPSEIVPGFEGARIYLFMIAACLAFSLPLVLSQLTFESLALRPVTACVLCLLCSVTLSHLVHLFFWGARTSATEFGKIILYYLLLVGLVNSHERLRNFLGWLLSFILFAAGLALLHDLNFVTVPGLQSLHVTEIDPDTGDTIEIMRLRSTGIFNDPNDLALIIVIGMMLSLYFMLDPQRGFLRLLWIIPLAVLCYALYMTQSRGGLISLLAAFSTLAVSRFGLRGAVVAACVAAGVIAAGGRMVDYDAIVDGTGQTRIQIWSEAMSLFREYPMFGIGQAELTEELGQVAHNSFLHCFVELGFFGGTLFLGAFATASLLLFRLRHDPRQSTEYCRMLPYILASLIGYVAGMLSLSRAYIVPTYLVLGVAAAAVAIATPSAIVDRCRFNSLFLQRMAFVSIAFLALTYVFIRVFVRWT